MENHAFANTVQRLALSYLQQPADAATVNNWSFVLQAHDGDLTCAISAFALAPNSLVQRGAADLPHWLGEIYGALFGREPKASETAFWQHKIDIQAAARDHLPWLIQAQASDLDAQIWQHRLDAAHAFAAGGEWQDPLLAQHALLAFIETPSQSASDLFFADYLSPEQEEIVALIGQHWPQDDWLML